MPMTPWMALVTTGAMGPIFDEVWLHFAMWLPVLVTEVAVALYFSRQSAKHDLEMLEYEKHLEHQYRAMERELWGEDEE